ncbi:HRDC domain-containing protein [Paenibacillus sp. 1_12]|uniref:HRDC domain-containing protein n=1 Tax=Paenibacillus sp. 1_12 TaxID=1566278 RepID=UPI0008E52EE3|nr:HRDC domain-containing protein [Paenibacillus sp. 1_12]SFL14141.1 HRDC domain-containing protein [Paenibacillus sp. 1_12]
MNLLFLNSLEKRVSEERTINAQVSIGESQGSWYVGWQETKSDGRQVQESWFEGQGWEDMLTAFRQNLFTKQCEGFKPVLEAAMLPEITALDRKTVRIQLLAYYSEIHANEELYEKLRQWRLKQASRESKAPFLVATNRLLRMVCVYLPHTLDELKQLPGMGMNKSNAYGMELLSMTQQHERSTPFPLDWVEDQVNPAEFNVWLEQEKGRKRKLQENKQEIRSKLLEAITRGDGLDALREQTQLERRDLLLWIEELDKEGYDMESYIEAVLHEVPEEEQALAWTAFEQKGDRYLKPILQAVYDPEALKGKEMDRIYEWLRALRMKYRRVHAEQAIEAV